jgi:hypothetical protein
MLTLEMFLFCLVVFNPSWDIELSRRLAVQTCTSTAGAHAPRAGGSASCLFCTVGGHDLGLGDGCYLLETSWVPLLGVLGAHCRLPGAGLWALTALVLFHL